jgi:hypothetical protein
MTFTNNVAGQGGGAVYVGRQNEYIFLLRGTTFAGNAVTGSRGTGGALAFNDGNEYVYAYSVAFAGNRAASGGAVAFTQSNSVLNFYGCSFVSNAATAVSSSAELAEVRRLHDRSDRERLALGRLQLHKQLGDGVWRRRAHGQRQRGGVLTNNVHEKQCRLPRWRLRREWRRPDTCQ